MSPEEIKAARHQLNLSLWQLATVLGFTGAGRREKMHEIETGHRQLGEPSRRLLIAYLEGYRSRDWDDIVSGKLRPTTEESFRSRS